MGQIPGSRKTVLIVLVLLASLVLIKLSGLYSQTTPITTISVSNEPRGLAINPTTNRAVVTNHNTNTVTVANLTNNTTTSVTVGQHPFGVAINSSTNKAYIANEKSDSVSVLNLSNNTIAATITVGGNPREIAVNSGTNTAVVANTKSDTVSILNISNNTVTQTVPVGIDPAGVVINTSNNRAFVTNSGSDTVSVIDLATKAVIATPAVGSAPSGIAINTTTQRIVIANHLSDTVTVLNGSTNALVATVPVGSGPTGVAINPTTNKAYITNTFSDSVSVIDLSNNTVAATYPVGRNPEGVAVVASTNQLVVGNDKGDTVFVIDLANPPTGAIVPVGKDPKGVALDRDTNVAVTADAKSNDLSVVDLSNGTLLATLTAGKAPLDVAIHPTSKRLVSANSKSNTASIYDLPTRTLIATVAVGRGPDAVAIDSVLNIAAVANERDGTLSLIDLSNNTVTATIAAGSHPTAIDIQPSSHLAVVANKKIDVVTIVDLVNRITVATVAVGKDPVSVAINPSTNIAAVANEKSNTLSIVNLSTRTVTATINVQATPTGVAINPVTNIASVVSHETKNLQIVDLSTNTVVTPTIAAGWEPEQVAINPDTNVAIVTNEDPGAVAIIPLSNPIPTLSNLSPTSAGAGGPGFTLTLNGAKFLKTSRVNFGGQSFTPQFVSSNQITADIPASAIAQSGTVQVSVTNLAPGGGVSGGLTFTINTLNNPVPTINSPSPVSATAGAAGFTLTVNGSNFISASSVSFNGQAVATTYVSSIQLTALIPASSIATAGLFPITVTNPAPGGGVSNAVTFTVNNLAPTTASISPASILAGSAGVPLTVDGANFVGSSAIRFNGTPLTTTFVNATRLTATIPANQLGLAGSFPVTVVNPAPGGGTSNAQTFTVNNPLPTLGTISPTSTIVGSAGFVLTVNGTNFVATSSVSFNGTALTTTYVSTTQLTASVPASAIAAAGTVTVTVTNPTPGGGNSGVQTFTVNNPLPATTSIAPISVLVGSGATPLTVNGTNFVSTSAISFNGTSLTTTYVNATQLTATIPSSLLASAGTFPIIVVSPGPGGGSSNAQSLTVTNPVPSIGTISPASVLAGSAGFTLTVNGTNFVATSSVSFNGTALTATYVSGTQLTLSVPASAVAAAGTFSVTVTNPPPGGGVSNAATFIVNNSVPTTTSITPTFILAGSGATLLTVNGTNFVSTSAVQFNGTALAATYVSALQLTATVPANLLLLAGNFPVTVVNPAPGGGTSNAQTFTVNNPVPSLGTISPSLGIAGGAGFNLTLNGTGFLATSSVSFNGTLLTATYVSATELTALVPASAITTAGTFPVTVVNPAPGGGVSNTQTFTVNNPVPTVGALSQNTVQAKSAGFILTLTGTNYVTASTATFAGSALTTTFVSATQLTAQLPAGLIASAGIFPIAITNPAPGGGSSNVVNFTVTNPVPSIGTIAPTSAISGSAAFALTINGTNFVNSSSVSFNGQALGAIYVSGTELTVSIPASAAATAGTFSVVVTNPAPGGGVSNTATFTVNNPTPALTALSSSSIQEGSAGFVLTLTGTNFVTTSTVGFTGSALATTFVNATQLTATVPASLIASAGSYAVTVTNAAPGGGTSNPLSFSVTNPPPSISAVSPTLVVTGSGLFILTVNGSNFVTTSSLFFDNQPLTTTFVSPTELTATVPASAVAASHGAQITVGNPSPGGGTSNTASLNVNLPPVADAGSGRAARVGKAIALDGRRSLDADGNRITFIWSILSAPAGSAALLVNPTGAQPTLTPDLAGTYQIQLIVSDGKADSAPAAVTVTATASNAPPNADAGFDQTAVIGQAITLDGRKSGDPDDDWITYRWSVVSEPSGSAAALTDAASVLSSFTPDLAGTYVVQLVVNDGTVDSAPAQMKVLAAPSNAPPMARAGKDRNALTGSPVIFDGSQSRDPNGDPLTYQWYFVSSPDGSAALLSGATTATPAFTPDLSGEYLVRLVVNDGASDSLPETILIVAASPNPAPNADAGADQTVHQTDTVTLDGTGSSDPNTDPVTYRWSIVSMPSGSQATLSSATAVHPSFVADAAGSYLFRLIVNDGLSNSFAATVVVTAAPIASLAVTPVNPSISQGQTQPFAVSAAFADNTTKDVTTLAAWTSSDATIATINTSGVATSLKGGTTLIRAAVGSIVSPAQTLTVISLPPTIGAFAPLSGIIGTAVTITGTNFDTRTPSNNKIKFNGTPAILTSVTATAITTTVPLGATTGPITITTLGGTSTSGAPFTVVAKEDFSITSAPAAVSVVQGKETTYQVKVSSAGPNPLTHLIVLSASGLPTGVSALFTPASASTAQGSTLTLKTTAAASAGSFTITVTGTASLEGKTVAQTATVQLSVLASGGTTLAGRILASKDDGPIPGAKLKLAGQVAITDASGNFFFPAPPIGEQVILLDGPTSIYPADLAIPATVAAGAANTLPYPIYLHEISQNFTSFIPGQEAVIQPSDVPDFTMIIPPGGVIMGWDGQPNSKVSITPVPLDRIAIRPVPPQVMTRTLYMFSFGKPGGGTPNQPIPIIYPNDLGAFPGERVDLWYYDESATPDPNSQQWKIYGQGTVTQDGKLIAPDPGVGMPKFCCGGSFASRNPSGIQKTNDPGPMTSPGDGKCSPGEPVDASSGIFFVEKTDMVLSGIVPIQIARTLRSGATGIGVFGIGGSFNFDLYVLRFGTASAIYYLPDGQRYTFSSQADGTFINTNYPFLRGVVITPLADGTTQVRLRDGTVQIFNGMGYFTEQRDRNNNRTVINRDEINRITTLVEPGGRALQFAYAVINDDRDGTITAAISSISDPLGRTVRYGYTGARLTTVTDLAGGVTTYGYGVNNQIVTVTDPKGITYLTNEYDSNNRVIKQTLADGGIYTFKYTLAGTAVTQTDVTDPNGNTTSYRFNNRQYLIRLVDAQGQMTRYERDFATNELMAIYDSQNRKTSFTYDLNGNATSIVDPAGNITLTEYEPKFNRPTKITDAIGNITRLTYDPSGNLIQTTDPLGNSSGIAYNSQGKPVTITDALGNVTQIEYDDVGNLITTTDPLGNKTQRSYDEVSRLVSLTDSNGKTTTYAYDLFGRVAQMTDAILGLTKFTYDPNGNLLTLTDAKLQTTIYTYDSMDRLATRTDPLSRQEIYAYDANGNLKTFTDRKGQRTIFTYDSLNRRIDSTFADGSNVSLTYDGMKRLSEVTDSNSGAIEFKYDFLLDRLAQESTSQGTVEYSYDVLGRRTAMTVNGGQAVTYTYDVTSRPTQIAQGTQNVGLTYDARGRRISLSYPNGTNTTYSYDAASRLTEILHLGPSGVIEDLLYSYDATRNRTSFTRTNGSATILPDAIQMAYDAANEQVQFNSTTSNLTYDANGNLVSETGVTGMTNYNWDARNRLIGINEPGINANFIYDAFGRRASKTINGVRTDYQYDGVNIISEIGGGTVGGSYLRSLRVDEPFIRQGSSSEYYHKDVLGSTVNLTDSAGAVTASYTYDAFGRTTAAGTSTNPFQYTGRESDGTGLYYYRARYYSPKLHRFLNEDPLKIGVGSSRVFRSRLNNLNLFAYVYNNPFRFIDPFGLELVEVCTSSGCSSADTGNGNIQVKDGQLLLQGNSLRNDNTPEVHYPPIGPVIDDAIGIFTCYYYGVCGLPPGPEFDPEDSLLKAKPTPANFIIEERIDPKADFPPEPPSSPPGGTRK